MNGANGHTMQGAGILKTLNRILILLQYSLASYLRYATPWTRPKNARLLEAVRQITADHHAHVERVGRLILKRCGKIEPGRFPTRFTAYNDLSLDYLARQLVEQEREVVGELAACADKLVGDPEARRLTEEILAGERRRLRTLSELISTSSEGGLHSDTGLAA